MKTLHRRCAAIILTLMLPLLGILVYGRFLTKANAAPPPPVPPSRYIAIMGEDSTQITGVAHPFINNGHLKPIRKYTSPAVYNYLREAPTTYFPFGFPPTLTLQVYEATTSTLNVNQVVSQVVSATQATSLTVEYTDLTWLSYRPRQFLISGDCNDIDSVIGQFVQPALGVTPRLLDEINLNFATLPPNCNQIRLYAITTISQVVDVVNVAANGAATLGVPVYAEPNYLTVGASDGSYIAGSPGGPQVPDALPATYGASPLGATGANVRVVIFDTVPYSVPNDGPATVFIEGVAINTWAPYKIPADLPQGNLAVPAHGTFVASPVAHMAPDADIHLVRVLNEYGIGDSYILYKAMALFIEDALRESDTLAGMVFNYSFVQEAPDNDVQQAESSMQRMLDTIQQLKIVQTGAAGNDSAYTSIPQEMRLPAANGSVMGVTAVARTGTGSSPHACYANRGDVAALGGGIGWGSGECNTAEIVDLCASGSNLDACVTGWDPGSQTQYDWGLGTSFAAPLVASVAAQQIERKAVFPPLAARATLLQPMGLASGPGHWPDPATIREAIYETANEAGPDLGAGVVPVPYLGAGFREYLPIMRRP